MQRTSFCYIFCLFAVTKRVQGPLFPKSHEWFGDSFLVFTQTQEFLSRIVAAVKHKGLQGEGRLVLYYDEKKYTGKAGRFWKASNLSHQSEYRIALETGTERPFHLEVGDLSDITSDVFPLDSADDVLKLRPEDFEAARLNCD